MQINKLTENQLRKRLLLCCRSTHWVNRMLADRPFKDTGHLHARADENWTGLEEADYLEAFAGHPKIGEIDVLRKKNQPERKMAAREQSGVNDADGRSWLDLLRLIWPTSKSLDLFSLSVPQVKPPIRC